MSPDRSVVVADDQALIRGGLRAILDAEPDIEVVVIPTKGVIAQQAGIPMDDAFERLRTHSRNHNERLHDLCLAVADGEIAATDLDR